MRVSFLLLFLIFSSGCASTLDDLRSEYEPSSAREAYILALDATGIAQSAMARDWVTQGDSALSTQLTPPLPYVEEGLLTPLHIVALAYRLDLKRGQRLTTKGAMSTDTDLFIDLFEELDNVGLSPSRVASADSLFTLSYDVTRSGVYILRVQPEILASGTFRLEVQTEASIVFPVSGKTTRSILSKFGVARDGGRRSHHGVDIFAARGTPVVAVESGRITNTKIGKIGGKVVWLRNSRGTNYYYAHLDSQMVSEGQQVQPGDTLGLVGNTGNARTTPPHLHFGVYARGPHDPWHYLFETGPATNRIRVPDEVFGREVLVNNQLYSAPSTRSAAILLLSASQQARVVGGTGSFLHVRLTDFTEGYVLQSEAIFPSD